MRAFSTLPAALFFAATTLAATITVPAANTLWDASVGTQNVAWISSPGDPANFTLALANTQMSPNFSVILKENVQTADNSTLVPSPSTGWPIGSGFQINLVRPGPTGIDVLTHSGLFNISELPTGNSSSVLSTPSHTSTGTSPSPTGTGINGNGSNGGRIVSAVDITVQTGFVAGLVIIGALLA